MRKSFDLATAIQSVETPEVQQLTFGELLRGYCSRMGADPADPLRLRKWESAFGPKSAWEITSAELATAALAMQQSGAYKSSSINRDLASVGSAYKWAIGKRITPLGFKSPTLGVRRFSEAESIRRVFIEPDQLKKLLAASLTARDRRFAIFCHLLVDSGARKGELYARRWRDVVLEKREIHLETSKTGEPRVLHFRPETADLIRRICPVRPPEGLVFAGYHPSEPKSYRAAWTKLVREVGLENLHLHDLRHDCARRLVVSGAPLAVAAAAMGHSVEMLTRRYGHLSLSDQRSAVENAWKTAA